MHLLHPASSMALSAEVPAQEKKHWLVVAAQVVLAHIRCLAAASVRMHCSQVPAVEQERAKLAPAAAAVERVRAKLVAAPPCLGLVAALPCLGVVVAHPWVVEEIADLVGPIAAEVEWVHRW